MSDLEEDRLEAYLKTFQPLRAEPLPDFPARGAKFTFPFAWAAAAGLAGLMLLAGVHDWNARNGEAPSGIAFAPGTPEQGPLTMSQINSLLAKADSLKAGLDEVAWRNRKVQLRPGQQSALAVLGKEKL